MSHVARICIYPIKSLDGIEVNTAKILTSGALKFDREFAIFDEQNKFVNGKRNRKVHLLRSQFNLEDRTVSLQLENSQPQQLFHLDDEQKEINTVLSVFFGIKVHLKQNLVMGFPDDTNSPGPTIISTATLVEVASWFPDITVEQMRARIRANIEIGGVPAFWEDQLFGENNTTIPFRIGNIIFEGINPCQRCIVPTRDAMTGESYPSFQQIFVKKRQETLPLEVKSSRFNHFYRLSVNTSLSPSEADKILQTGSNIEIL